jgi:hypothetical protein
MMSKSRRATLSLRAGAAAFFLALAPAAFAAPTVHLVPADDNALAIVTLIGRGLKDPVLLVDARDQAALSAAAAEWKGEVECYYRPAAHHAVVEAMAVIADESCAATASLGVAVHELWPQPKAVVVVLEQSYDWLLQGAAFAGATGAAILPLPAGARLDAAALGDWTQLERIYLTAGVEVDPSVDAAKVRRLNTPTAVIDELKAEAGEKLGKVVVVTNPQDRLGTFSPSSLSLVAPLVSAMHKAPLILASSAAGEVVEREVLAAIDTHALTASHIILVGDELGLRSHRIPDPVLAAGGPEARGGGTIVRVELFSQIQNEQPQDFAVGRVVAEDAAQASALLARQQHRRNNRAQRPVVFLTNADSVFALGETISRATTRDLSNLGVTVRAYYRGEITPEIIRQTMLQTNVLVWEGHPRDLTLEERGGIAVDTAPEIAILQGCYTLDRSDPMILIEKGTEAIVATSAAIYSAPGSAFARALFDAALYDDADLGIAVRNARNYLLALAQLQRLRGYKEWHKTFRAALAFALWGDPTLTIPLKTGKPSVKPVLWEASGDELTLSIPRQRMREIAVDNYVVKPAPRTMYGGLVVQMSDGKRRELKDMYYDVRRMPEEQKHVCRPDQTWGEVISLYAPRSRTLFVLARPEWEKYPERKQYGTYEFRLGRDASICVGPTQPAGAELTP